MGKFILSCITITISLVSARANERIGLGVGIGDTQIELNLPDLNLGVSFDYLITEEITIEIQNRPVNYDKLPACTTNDSPVDKPRPRNGLPISYNRRWYYDQGKREWYMPVAWDPYLTTDEKNVITAGIQLLHSSTNCFRYYLFQESYLQQQGFDYVYIQRTNQGCYSTSIGRNGRKQIVNLQPTNSQGYTCMFAGIVAHELLHATGFHHAQNQPGRDNYVTIMYQNMNQDTNTRYQFQECTYCTTFGAPYDYDSLMHYGAYDFTNNGQKTIVTKNGAAIGQRSRVSQWDAFKLNKMHDCPA